MYQYEETEVKRFFILDFKTLTESVFLMLFQSLEQMEERCDLRCD